MSFEYMNSKESIINYKNYSYSFNKIYKAAKFYRCSFNNECTASLSIIDNTIDKDNFNHNHNPILPKIIAKNKLNIACPATVANNSKQIILSDQDKTINGSLFLREYILQTEFMIFFSEHALLLFYG